MNQNPAIDPAVAVEKANERFVLAMWAAMGESLYSANASHILTHLKQYNIGAFNEILCIGFDVDVRPERYLDETAPNDEFFVSTVPGFKDDVLIQDRITSLAQGYSIAAERFGLEALYLERMTAPG